MSKSKARTGTALFEIDDDLRDTGLRAIENCPRCLKFTLSEVIVCKGINKIENRGRFYQKCLNNVGNGGRSPRKRRKGNQAPEEYRPYCDGFLWRTDYQQMPDWWVSEVTQNVSPNVRRQPVKCPGEDCQRRPKPHNGNRECSNGQLCKECCIAAQLKGYHECLCTSHNRSLFDDHIEKNRALAVGRDASPKFGISESPSIADAIRNRKPAGSTTISPYHEKHRTSELFVSASQNLFSPKQTVEFQVVWHSESSSPETLSASAPYGKFSLFQDAPLVNHLGIGDTQSVQHFDSSQAKWVTTLRNSPALKIVAHSTHHFKLPAVHVSFGVVVESHLNHTKAQVIDRPVRVKKEASVSDDVFSFSKSDQDVSSFTAGIVDLCNSDEESESCLPTPSPTPAKRKNLRRSPSIPFIGIEDDSYRPSTLSDFPALDAFEMDERFKWISDNEALGPLSKRFSSVFSCEYKSSTFHKHWAYWRWLRDSGELRKVRRGAPWKALIEKVPRRVDDDDAKTKLEPSIVFIDP